MTRIAVIGAGLIGERHARLVHKDRRTTLTAIVDPAPAAQTLCAQFGVAWFATLAELLKSETSVDGVIVATPNATHKPIGLEAIEAGIACLIEKPLAANSQDAAELETASRLNAVPVLVGHHRRYHEASGHIRKLIDDGAIGAIMAAQVTWCLRKPDEYFEAAPWRQQAGGGPVWINLIHEIDLLRYFLGEVQCVTAMLSNKARGAAVEDCASIILRCHNGALATILVSDATPSPWHFEGASAENPNIAATRQDGMRLFGRQGSLSFPSMKVWQHRDQEKGHWGTDIEETSLNDPSSPCMDGEVALGAQLHHFCDVIEGNAQPLVSAMDGLQNILVTEAILEAASTGQSVTLTRKGDV